MANKEQIADIVSRQRRFFRSGATLSYYYNAASVSRDIWLWFSV